MRKKVNDAVVLGEAWASVAEKLFLYLPSVAGFFAMTGLGTWFASGWSDLAGRGWGVYPIVGVVFALAVSISMAAVAFTVDRWKRRNETRAIDAGVSVERSSLSAPNPSESICIVDMMMDVASLHTPSPWLSFHCVGFNGNIEDLRLVSGEGRIRLGGAEFHSRIELESTPGPVNAQSLFRFSLRLAPTSSEVAHFDDMTKPERDNHLVVQFRDAAIRLSSINGVAIRVAILPTVQFLAKRGQASSSYPQQMLIHQRA